MATQKPPFNIKIMDVDAFIQNNMLLEVTSTLIKAPSSIKFAEDGLFSEQIFGEIGTSERMLKHGYISLNTDIIAPVIYDTIISMGSLYKEIMQGSTYAVFNNETKDFEKVFGDPEEHEDSDTGYSFFIRHLHELQFKNTGSPQRESFIELIDKYRDQLLCNKTLVLPAGLRDISLDNGGMMIQDDINKYYVTLLAYASSIPKGASSTIYDNVRYNIQLKLYEIYNYLLNFISGKTGFIQAHYASRSIALGTRNVISAPSFSVQSTTDPQALKPDETKVGLFQTMKGMMPLIKYGCNTYLLENLSYKNPNITTIPLINKKTYELENVEISDETKRKYTSSEGVEAIINNFINFELRSLPIEIETLSAQKSHYLMLVYDLEDTVYFFRSISDLKLHLNDIDRSKIRPMTWIEALYVITNNIVKDKHMLFTRYPVLGDGSTVISRIHLCSTNPARAVELKNLIDPSQPGLILPEYPILGNGYMDTVSVSPYRLALLGADHDGDTGSTIFVMSDEANAECEKYINSKAYLIDVQKNFTHIATSTMDLAIHNLTMD